MVVVNMRLLAILAVLAAVCWKVDSKFSPPKVQVYSHKPAQFGEQNTVICHVSEFHPPDINIQLFKNGVEITEAVQTDLSFKKNWHFHLTKHIDITPMEGDKYICKVIHATGPAKDYDWEPNM
ncbi:beta-2-microglobulin [Dunckerocampus dactyliophorus]|uniref:beta-2-microglobulin n=1 Tax=Dunckerocampus dactyliophorus TaxID=161453 RepID=UPI002405DF6D|nr:beta-2-microglobulin [Dunckerocampus dactyliophorus]